MGKNKDFFFAGGDALVYLAKPMLKKYSTKLLLGNQFSTHVSYERLFNSPPRVRTCTHFWWSPLHSPSCVLTYLTDGLFLNQKTNKYIRISYSLKYKHSKKKSFKSHICPKIMHLISVTLSPINSIIVVHFKSYLSQCF